MSKVKFDFLNWQPDQEDYRNGGLITAENLIHAPEGYKQVKNFVTGGTGSYRTGLVHQVGDTGEFALLVAQVTTTAGVFIGAYGAGGTGLSLPTGAGAATILSLSSVEFNDHIISCSTYSWTGGAGTTRAVNSSYITYPTALPGASAYNGTWTVSAFPNSVGARVCGRVNNFVVVGNYDSGDTGDYSIRWSALGDAEDWPIPGTADARTKQAGEQVFDARYGDVTGIAGNDFYAYVFQERAVTKMTYVGGDVVFTFDTFEEVRGCYQVGRFVQVDDAVYFESRWNRHVALNGEIADIGFGIVDKTYPPVDDESLRLEKNAAIHCVFFSNNLIYNYKTNQWTRAPNITARYSVENTEGIIGQLYKDGSFIYRNTSSGGAAATATVVTGEFELNPAGRAVVDGVRPLSDGASLSSVRIGVRNLLSDAVSYVTGSSVNSRSGMSHFRGGHPSGRYARGEFVFTGGFTTVTGADFEFYETGDT